MIQMPKYFLNHHHQDEQADKGETVPFKTFWFYVYVVASPLKRAHCLSVHSSRHYKKLNQGN